MPVGERELTGPRKDMPDLAPVHEVAAVEERHAGEILERAGHEEVVLPDAADARVRVEAGNDRIRKRHGLLCRLALGGSRVRSSARASPQSVEMPAGRGIAHAGLFPRGW